MKLVLHNSLIVRGYKLHFEESTNLKSWVAVICNTAIMENGELALFVPERCVDVYFRIRQERIRKVRNGKRKNRVEVSKD